jgi:hypothetical protein
MRMRRTRTRKRRTRRIKGFFWVGGLGFGWLEKLGRGEWLHTWEFA